MIKVKLKKPFKLYDTVICGQIFRFFPLNDGSFDVILKDRVINIYQKDNALYVSSNDETDLEALTEYALSVKEVKNKSSHIEFVKSKLNDLI